MTTSFTPILRSAVDHTPGAVAAIFADSEGEAIDQVATNLHLDELLVLGAHYGILLHMIKNAIDKLGLGMLDELMLEHDKLNVLIRPVVGGYYVVMAMQHGGHLATALMKLECCVAALRAQM